MNKKRQNSPKKPRKAEIDNGCEDLPYPDSDLSPALQRTIKRKIDAGEIDEVDAETFFGVMRQLSEPEQADEES